MKSAKHLLMVVMFTFAVLGLMGCGTTKVSLNKYMKLEASGYDSAGILTYNFDYTSYKADYEKKISLKKNKKKENLVIRGTAGDSDAELMLWNCVDYRIDKTMDLKNGDKITLTWDCDEETAKEYFGCALECKPITYTVSGLEEIGKFNPFDYLEVAFSGVDGNGTAYADVANKRSEFSVLNINVDPYYGLSNGDQVTVRVSTYYSDADFARTYGSVLAYKEKTFTVSGLKEPVELNAFEDAIFNVPSGAGVTISYSGFAPDAEVSITNNIPAEDPRSRIQYSANPSKGLKQGDTVEITASLTGSMVEEGYTLGNTTTTVTVENVDQYITSAAQITANMDAQIRSQIDDIVEAKYAADADAESTGHAMLGYYVLTPKQHSYGVAENQVWAIYKVNIHHVNGDASEDVTAYRYLKFTNAVLYADGTGYIDIMNYTQPEYGWWGNEGFSTELGDYLGYTSLDILYNQCIACQKAEWTIDSSVQE